MTDLMLLARAKHLPDLPLPKRYRVGKYTSVGPGKTKREVLFDLRGRGVLRRIWTTHGNTTRVRIFLYVDGAAEPVTHGYAHELARMAEGISRPGIPLGGYLHGKSANLYAPLRFSTSLRAEADPEGDVGDGPYWQIDYALEPDEPAPADRVSLQAEGLRLTFDSPAPVSPAPSQPVQVVEDDFLLAGASPRDIRIAGPAVIRRIEITSEALDSLLLRVAFDDAVTDAEPLDGPFQVDAPLRYLVGHFNNVCVERLGTSAVIYFPMPFRRAAGIQVLAAMDYGKFGQKYPVRVRAEYEPAAKGVENMYYFHARFACQVTNGRDDFECLSTTGRGHFVGLNLFDTGHDHGGGDNMMFDAGSPTAGQLHGVCGEDYFHMAYMEVFNRTPYSGCPTHSQRYRYHLEMPVPFEESFVFNWGAFASQPAKAVAFWYQDRPAIEDPRREMTWRLTGPFPLQSIDEIAPHAPLPDQALAWPPENIYRPRRTWAKRSQRGFVDLCHVHRRYIWRVPESTGYIAKNICTAAETTLWAVRDAEAELLIGCDDPIRVFLNGQRILRDEGCQGLTPFALFTVQAKLCEGRNRVFVVVGNTTNTNWLWNGFSLRVRSALGDDELLFLA